MGCTLCRRARSCRGARNRTPNLQSRPDVEARPKLRIAGQRAVRRAGGLAVARAAGENPAMGAALQRVLAAVTGPRGRWVTIAVWVMLAAIGSVAHGHLDDVTAAGQSSFLPAHSQSTRAASVLKSDFRGGENVPLFVLFDRPSGLTEADRTAIGRIGLELQRLGLDGATPVFDPLTTRGGSCCRMGWDWSLRRSGGDRRPRDQRGAP